MAEIQKRIRDSDPKLHDKLVLARTFRFVYQHLIREGMLLDGKSRPRYSFAEGRFGKTKTLGLHFHSVRLAREFFTQAGFLEKP